MVATRNAKYIFKEALPSGYPEPGKHIAYDASETIDLDHVALNGGLLVKTLVVSMDPYLRNRLRGDSAFVLGEPLENFAVGVVTRSESSAVKTGDYVYGVFQFAEYFVESDPSKVRVLPKTDIPVSAFLGVAGMPGQTAVYSWKEFSQAKKGDIVFVSTAAGAVGSVVVQLAKQQGLKVIGSAGSDEKVQFLKDIGTDVAFNYKTQSTREVLEREGPIDIYYDNVGGETLEAALDNAATEARFIICGAITGYNEGYVPIKNVQNVLYRSISMHGFNVGRLAAKHGNENDFYKTFVPDVLAGKIKYTEQRYQGLESVGQAFLDVQKGKNTGKAVIVLADQ